MPEVILVTGGAGYIGSHTLVQLLNAGYEVIVFDNLSNSKSIVLERVTQITGKKLQFYKGDIRNPHDLKAVFNKYTIDAVIHFAGLKSVAESEINPLDYYATNVTGSLNLITEMARSGVFKLIFSSSATVYGAAQTTAYHEHGALAPINVYGRTKCITEYMLTDVKKADARWKVALLRYFNPIGAHVSGLIGEDPNTPPNNIMPMITQVAVGTRKQLTVFGNDYPTPDGTCLRDYIHVDDLAAGHLAALRALNNQEAPLILNLGTGKPYSVLELIKAFEQASNKVIPYHIGVRRTGDLAAYYADVQLAKEQLGWSCQYDLPRMCEDAWRWQLANPKGYE